jgi:RNA polymerase sigma-70 factor (ECF subfamily)
MSSSERDLILRATQGDKKAFGALYEIYLDPIYRFIFYRVSNEQEAEDMAEEVFIRAWNSLPNLKDGAEIQNFRSWLYRVARNLIVDRYRKKNLEVEMEDQTFLTDQTPQPDAAVLMEEESSLLRDAIRKLEEPFREVLVHRFVNELSHAETAGLMGLRENHIRVLQYRALKKLRSILEAGGPQ